MPRTISDDDAKAIAGGLLPHLKDLVEAWLHDNVTAEAAKAPITAAPDAPADLHAGMEGLKEVEPPVAPAAGFSGETPTPAAATPGEAAPAVEEAAEAPAATEEAPAESVAPPQPSAPLEPITDLMNRLGLAKTADQVETVIRWAVEHNLTF
jgi:hypothetical protein